MSPPHRALLGVLALGCEPQPPEISALAVDAQDFTANITFLAQDPDGDLLGGRVLLEVGGQPTGYPLESDDRTADRRAVVSTRYRYSACQVGEIPLLEVRVADAEGLVSEPLRTSLEFVGEVVQEAAVNSFDWPETSAICGGLEPSAFGVGDSYEFLARVTGTRTIVLQAPFNAAFDLSVTDLYAGERVSRGTDSVLWGGFRWSRLDAYAGTDDSFWVYVSAEAGTSGQYSLFIE